MLRLGQDAVASGYRLIERGAVGSTNDEAFALDVGHNAVWIVAESQSGGRGRLGRNWLSPAGNLYASLLLRRPCAPCDAPHLGFVAGLALFDAVAAMLPDAAPSLALKWPNDLLLGNAKLSGVLLEGRSSGATIDAVIGFGVNCASAPDDLPYPATSLAATGADGNRETLFARLSNAMVRRLAQWDRGQGFASVRTDWLARSLPVGTPVLARTQDCLTSGVFAGLEPDGRLILERGDGSRAVIDAADLYPMQAALPAPGSVTRPMQATA